VADLAFFQDGVRWSKIKICINRFLPETRTNKIKTSTRLGSWYRNDSPKIFLWVFVILFWFTFRTVSPTNPIPFEKTKSPYFYSRCIQKRELPLTQKFNSFWTFICFHAWQLICRNFLPFLSFPFWVSGCKSFVFSFRFPPFCPNLPTISYHFNPYFYLSDLKNLKMNEKAEHCFCSFVSNDLNFFFINTK
jgi:hypothetical protein